MTSSQRMTKHEWKTRFAPHGYQFVKTRIEFHALEFSQVGPKFVIQQVMNDLHHRLGVKGDEAALVTLLSIYPFDVGEHLNCHDRLKGYYGIEIEVRMPASPKEKK